MQDTPKSWLGLLATIVILTSLFCTVALPLSSALRNADLLAFAFAVFPALTVCPATSAVPVMTETVALLPLLLD